MHKIFELARNYPIESVLPLGERGFAFCCGSERFLEEWCDLDQPVMSRSLLPLADPATSINFREEGAYCLQSLNQLALISQEGTHSVQINEGVICSRTVRANRGLIHLTSNGKLRIYKQSLENQLQLIASENSSAAINRLNKPLIAANEHAVLFQNFQGQLELFDVHQLVWASRMALPTDAPIGDLLQCDRNRLVALSAGQLLLVDLRVRRVSARAGCHPSTNSLRQDSNSAAILFDEDNMSISKCRFGYPTERYARFIGRSNTDIIKSFECLSPQKVVVVNGHSSSLEIYASEHL